MDALRVPIAEADLPSLIERAAAGERVVFTRDGEVVAELHPIDRKAAAREALMRLAELRTSLPPAPKSSVEVLREMYDERGY